jgi:hypothetical protein
MGGFQSRSSGSIKNHPSPFCSSGFSRSLSTHQPNLLKNLAPNFQTQRQSFNLETGMERDEDGVVLGSTSLSGSQRLHR